MFLGFLLSPSVSFPLRLTRSRFPLDEPSSLLANVQNVWVVFLLYIGFSKYGNIKFGRQDEKPLFNNISWFSMLFSCGIAVGVYTFGVPETLDYYRRDTESLGGRGHIDSDDDRASTALLQIFYHWGFHAWAPYITVAVALGVTSYRWNLPLTMRSAFYPLLGNLVYSPIGDIIDAAAIATTTFGVCTSLGLGVAAIVRFANRLNSDVENDIDSQVATVVVMTFIAMFSVVLGLKKGMQVLSTIAFSLGLFSLIAPLFLDNTWFLLNSYVQALGHYLSWFAQIGFRTDAFEQLQTEFSEGNNLLWGSSNSDHGGHVYDAMVAANALRPAGDMKFTDADHTLTSAALYGSHDGNYMMDSWTVFYWGWWVSWAPFVGMFIARISRGRTIREVIFGGFIAPSLFGFLWLGVWGSLAIKMQRVAEIALGAGTEYAGGSTWGGLAEFCYNHGYGTMAVENGVTTYTNSQAPVSAAAIKLADEGYYLLSCRSWGVEVLDIMEPYKEVTKLIWVTMLVGIVLYFVTSSDSGSYVDDIISAGGLIDPPVIQKIFWCWTEGAVCIALLKAGDVGGTGTNGLRALQAVSIVCGLPFTIAIVFMCTSIMRALKIDSGDADICESTEWSTGTLDMFDAFNPGPATESSPPRVPALDRVKHYVVSMCFPFVGVYKTAESLWGEKSPLAAMHGVINACFFFLWIVFMIMSADSNTWAYLGWTFYAFKAFQLTFIRGCLREAHNIYGNMAEDFAAALFMYPNVVSQMHYQSEEKRPDADVFVKGESAPDARL